MSAPTCCRYRGSYMSDHLVADIEYLTSLLIFIEFIKRVGEKR